MMNKQAIRQQLERTLEFPKVNSRCDHLFETTTYFFQVFKDEIFSYLKDDKGLFLDELSTGKREYGVRLYDWHFSHRKEKLIIGPCCHSCFLADDKLVRLRSTNKSDDERWSKFSSESFTKSPSYEPSVECKTVEL
jgi:hypothetical protein